MNVKILLKSLHTSLCYFVKNTIQNKKLKARKDFKGMTGLALCTSGTERKSSCSSCQQCACSGSLCSHVVKSHPAPLPLPPAACLCRALFVRVQLELPSSTSVALIVQKQTLHLDHEYQLPSSPPSLTRMLLERKVWGLQRTDPASLPQRHVHWNLCQAVQPPSLWFNPVFVKWSFCLLLYKALKWFKEQVCPIRIKWDHASEFSNACTH